MKILIPNLIIDWGLQQFILTLVVEDWQHWIILSIWKTGGINFHVIKMPALTGTAFKITINSVHIFKRVQSVFIYKITILKVSKENL